MEGREVVVGARVVEGGDDGQLLGLSLGLGFTLALALTLALTGVTGEPGETAFGGSESKAGSESRGIVGHGGGGLGAVWASIIRME